MNGPAQAARIKSRGALTRNSEHIHIGDYYASKTPAVIHTILGSCVAVCLFDPVARIGGMNHILLPGRPDLNHGNAPARYGVNAMELLINKIMNLGGNRRRLAAKAFGGASVMPSITGQGGVGERNAAFVVEFLRVENIRLLDHDLGGGQTRKILFHTDTGEVFLKRLPGLRAVAVAVSEQKGLCRGKKEAVRPGRITLFSS